MQSAISLERKVAGQQIFFAVRGFYAWFVAQFAMQRPHLFLWSPVFLAFGIGAYFSLGAQVPISVLLVVGAFASAVAFMMMRTRPQATQIFMLVFGLFMLGFIAAQIRTESVYTPMLSRAVNMAVIEGVVKSVEELEGAKGVRVVLEDLRIENLAPEETPRRVRLSYRGGTELEAGQRVNLRARLNAPATPTMPDGFDFRRHLYFQGIGAVGFIYNIENASKEKAGGFSQWVERVRETISNRISAHLPPRDAAFVKALTIGKRGGIGEEDQQALRDAGLAHLLAISGLHVGLMAGAIFFVLRLGLAAFPQIALRYPIKKIAAVAAFLAAVCYMLVSGMSIPTQRAVLTTGAIFLAIFIDRSPFSLRLVAFAAFVVLLFSPESLLSASFHMSFAAVIALIAFYDATRPIWTGFMQRKGALNRLAVYLIGVGVTTVIASLATGIFSLYHFQNFALFGVVANFVAVPLMAFVIMPFALIALILAPFGGDGFALAVMGAGVEQILSVAHFSARLPFAAIKIAAWPSLAIIMFSMAGIWLVLWRGVGKVLCLVFVVIGAMAIFAQDRPIGIVAASHKLFGFYDGQNLYVNTIRADKFTRGSWESVFGMPDDSAVLMKRGDPENMLFRCDDDACRIEVSGVKIALVEELYALSDSCLWADVVIVKDVVDKMPRVCFGKDMIGKFDVLRRGAHAIYRKKDGGIEIKNTEMMTGNRPWALEYVRRGGSQVIDNK